MELPTVGDFNKPGFCTQKFSEQLPYKGLPLGAYLQIPPKDLGPWTPKLGIGNGTIESEVGG